MGVYAGNGRIGGDARLGRRSDSSVEDLRFENTRLGREVMRLQALCEKHEANLLRLTKAMWRMRREAVQAESTIAELRGELRLLEDLRRSGEAISSMADQNRLGIPDARGQVAAFEAEAARGQSARAKPC